MSDLELFAEAMDYSDPAARETFLKSACPDESTRHRIEALLARRHDSNSMLDRKPADMLAAMSDTTVTQHSHSSSDADTEAELSKILGPSDRPGAMGRVGHYDVLNILGRGGFGIVVKAFDESLHRIVAIKFLNPALAATSPPRQRFLREARAAGRVKNDHVVQVYFVEEQPVPYLVMEFVEGQTLQDHLDQTGPLPPADVITFGEQIALGLAAAHDQGLIHRDVKPSNVLIEAGVERRVKLTDFGVARAADDASMTQSGVLAGTPLYMAPEQARGDVLDARADLFSLGSLLYTMVAGRPAFRAANAYAVLKRVTEDRPRPLQEVIGGTPPGLIAVIEKLMAKQPEDRFASARDVAHALNVCLTNPQIALPARKIQLPWKWIAAATAILIVLIAAIVLISKGMNRTDAPVIPPVMNQSTPANQFIVTSTLDDGSTGTLRWAVKEANLHHGEDTITFDPNVFSTMKTITLVQGALRLEDHAETAILGPSAGLIVSGDDKSQVFIVGPSPGSRARFTDLTIVHGRPTGGRNENDIPYGDWLGGGILCTGGAFVTMIGCTFTDNESTIRDGGGGGIYNHESSLMLVNCTFTRNRAFEGGGVKTFVGVTRIFNCTFSGNSCERIGNAVWNGGYNRTRTEIYNCLFADKENRAIYPYDKVEIQGDYNLSVDDTVPGEHSLQNVEMILLGEFGKHGGPTETFPLLAGSPAIDAGSNSRIPSTISTDQRGKPRIGNQRVDIGAVESN